MSDFNSKPFTPQLPQQGKWSVGENKYDQDGSNPKQLTVFIPESSIDAFCSYLQAQRSKLKPGKVYNYKTKENDDAQGIWLNFKGKAGSDNGSYGNINPAAVDSAPAPVNSAEVPF